MTTTTKLKRSGMGAFQFLTVMAACVDVQQLST